MRKLLSLQFLYTRTIVKKGIGTALMKAMISLLKEKGYEKASLAVQKDNYAVRMYQSVGFEIVSELEEEFLMVCKLK